MMMVWFTFLISIIGAVNVGWMIYSYKRFTKGMLKDMSRALVLTSFTGAIYAVWMFLVYSGAVSIGYSSARDLPGNLLVLGFFVAMFYDAYLLHRMAKLFGFRPKKKR